MGGEKPAEPPCVPGFLDLCGLPEPTDSLMLSGELDTAIDPRCQPFPQSGGPEVCLIYASEIEIASAGVVAYGTRPLAIAAVHSLKVQGALDVSSKRSRPGAGASSSTDAICNYGQVPVANTQGAGGGAGGSFATAGGGGGVGNVGAASTSAGGIPGSLQPTPTILRGGCNGQDGAAGQDPAISPKGTGGGAVYLVADEIEVSAAASVLAGGSGAGASGRDDGGGGGGSGGLIVIHAATLRLSGLVIATGGGGSQGGAGTGTGQPGADATSVAAAEGGQSATHGGWGGDGATDSSGAIGLSDDDGGGGGGGGAGFILVRTTQEASIDATKIMPPAAHEMVPPPQASTSR